MATKVDTGGHVWFKCSHEKDSHRGCYFCDGGLALCTVCGAAEGELLSHCPGFSLSAEAKAACYSGNVFDLTYLRRLKEHCPEYFQKLRKQWNTRP
jgi:hypothetical protein